jgi:DNA-binding NarL/FixJ family response regulator
MASVIDLDRSPIRAHRAGRSRPALLAAGYPTSVLVVARHEAVRAGLERLVAAQRDLRVVASAADASEALAAAERQGPDVAVIDVELADHDGLWLTSRLKQLERAPHVLLLSAYADIALMPQAVLAGADGMLNLGVLGERIVQAIRTVRRGGFDLPTRTGAVAQRVTAPVHPLRADRDFRQHARRTAPACLS